MRTGCSVHRVPPTTAPARREAAEGKQSKGGRLQPAACSPHRSALPPTQALTVAVAWRGWPSVPVASAPVGGDAIADAVLGTAAELALGLLGGDSHRRAWRIRRRRRRDDAARCWLLGAGQWRRLRDEGRGHDDEGGRCGGRITPAFYPRRAQERFARRGNGTALSAYCHAMPRLVLRAPVLATATTASCDAIGNSIRGTVAEGRVKGGRRGLWLKLGLRGGLGSGRGHRGR